MSRTAAHITSARAQTEHRTAWRAVVLTDLRYSAAILAEAQNQGRRPRPVAHRRAVVIHSFPRAYNGNREIARLARISERRSRRVLRRALGTVLREVNAGGRLHADKLSTVDVTVAPHRHGARWHAW
ncbi:hypothetical protein N8J89_32730 [Crossiella sp. CA-258035]|uniref:hypothetical protein n=1 Tax=Crossiella sp. CA-258035 TaxID=2981138 RepID=UPI0024BCC591|nr:hypothetical protein [Crossiella sp. CA-258035]WHT17848.1 hypothetical protein N8J89_32730 [Crossiella sp. CA-258035]